MSTKTASDGVIKLTHNGKTMTISEWSNEVGISCRTLASRIGNGWDHSRALTEPISTKVGRGAKAAGGLTKNDAELFLDGLPAEAFPKRLKQLIQGFGGSKRGRMVRYMYPKLFNAWFDQDFPSEFHAANPNPKGVQPV